MNHIDTVIRLISARVGTANLAMSHMNRSDFDRRRNELIGMLVCLRNIDDSDRHYCIDYYADHIEFGYFVDHKWVKIK